jgi:cell division septation protein DedD
VSGNERQTAPASTSQHAVAKVPSPSAGYRVQVGSFRDRQQADSLMHRLTQKGYRVAIQPTTIPGKGVWYRVQVGGFPERGTADRLVQQLATQERVAGVVIDGSR